MPQTMFLGVQYAIKAAWTNARPIVTTFHAVMNHQTTREQALIESANHLGTQWQIFVLPLLPNNYSMETISFVDLNSATGLTGEVAFAGGLGGNVVSSLPPSSGALARKNIAAVGRAFRPGRTFLPGGSEADVDEDGVVTAARRTAINDALNGFLGGVAGVGGLPNVASMKLVVAHTPSIAQTTTVTRRVPDPDGVLTPSDILSFATDQLISGIRRRVRP